jgi:hypothetical protein
MYCTPMITILDWSVSVMSPAREQELVAFYVNLMVWIRGHLSVSSWMRVYVNLRRWPFSLALFQLLP